MCKMYKILQNVLFQSKISQQKKLFFYYQNQNIQKALLTSILIGYIYIN